MNRLARLLLCLAALTAVPARAETAIHRAIEEEVEARALAAFGPFRVLDDRTAALVDVTDEASPAQFQAMLGAYPGLSALRFLECPGTFDDVANLRLGQMIRAAGLAAEVPAEGSVRSGAVELVLAGATRKIDDRAEFAVHAWQDESGREAGDYAPDAAENAKYLTYYREMGLAADTAAAFYAMTNSASFEHARWLTGAEIRRWLGEADGLPVLAYLDLGLSLN